MLSSTFLCGFGAETPRELTVDSADFDGSADYMTTGTALTGVADSKSGTLSCWARFDGDGTLGRIFAGFTAVGGAVLRFGLFRSATHIITLSGATSGGVSILAMASDTAYAAGATWHHILASWDLAAAAGDLYIDDASDLASGATLTDGTIDYTLADWAVGANASGSALFNGCLAELWFLPGTYIDLSVEANRRKFIGADGKPVDLGVNGASPSGGVPLYLHLDDGEAVANFAVNRGSAEDFSITGTLTTGSTSPND